MIDKDQKIADLEVKLAETLFRFNKKVTILNSITQSVVSVDNHWRYTFLNDAALATHPLPKEELIGKVIWDIHPEMKGTIFWDKYHHAMETKQEVSIQSYYEPMNSWFEVKVFPSAEGLTILYSDITKAKKVERDIQRQQEFLAFIVDSLPGIFYLYDREGHFLQWNKNFQIISEYSDDEIMYMHPLDFFEESEKQLLAERIGSVFENKSADVEAHFYTKSKRKIPYYFNGHAFRMNDKEYLMGVGIDITERKNAEKLLIKSQHELRRLNNYLQTVREEERTNIAREIHDELGQQLTALKMDAYWLSKKIEHLDQAQSDKIDSMLQLIDSTVKTVRRISTDLRPGILDDLGLIAALEWQASEFEKKSGIKNIFSTTTTEIHFDKNKSIGIFRIYQEALTNIMRHAEASIVHTSIVVDNNTFKLTIKDNGKGFNIEQVKVKETLGLTGIRERATMLNADIDINTLLGKGTEIILKLDI